MAKKRPIYLNLFKIKLPLPGVVSFLHRISGALLFIAIPFLLAIFQQSLGSAEGFGQMRECLASPPVKLLVVGTAWAFFHHFFAGLRFLALDLHLGGDLPQARKTSAAALAGGIAAALLTGACIW
ncbi:MAG: succinate dehydrogenase, cytochrome b556 subunit [Pseudomonadota bacterium]|jgi:succinate dehydrogenase / fumarate reductase cytochrome b subunit